MWLDLKSTMLNEKSKKLNKNNSTMCVSLDLYAWNRNAHFLRTHISKNICIKHTRYHCLWRRKEMEIEKGWKRIYTFSCIYIVYKRGPLYWKIKLMCYGLRSMVNSSIFTSCSSFPPLQYYKNLENKRDDDNIQGRPTEFIVGKAYGSGGGVRWVIILADQRNLKPQCLQWWKLTRRLVSC